MVHRTACPAAASFFKNDTIRYELCPSRPEVGSSKKSKTLQVDKFKVEMHKKDKGIYGLETNSTPIVNLFLCSTPSPAPGSPTRASSMSCNSSRSIMVST